jgi:DNA topoisomerase-1
MKLVIIEGIGKVKTVEKYLGKGYKVFATKGHIRDLPEKTLAVNVNHEFEPRYEIIPSKHEVVREMKEMAGKADEIYLCTDPDREGEAISWHIAYVLDIPPEKPVRAVFNEISEKAIKNGLSHPRAIDINLVDAQQARRVLDRLVGYKISPVLCRKIQGNLSAGRVQSVTLRLVVEREREIQNFKPEEYWNFYSFLSKVGDSTFKSSLSTKNGKKIKLKNADEVAAVKEYLTGKDYFVNKITKKVVKSHALPPFITSSMQQDALNKLGMPLSTTTKVAQTLYEGVDVKGEGKVALVTYIRTDSTRVSPDAQRAAREFIAKKFGDKYVPDKPNYYAAKKTAQDAHEAIRPITLDRSPEDLKGKINANEYKLYKLIYDRFLASQMSEAISNTVSVDISCGVYGFKVSGKTPVFPGYTAVYKGYSEETDEDSSDKLPSFNEGEKLNFKEFKYEQKFTKPPSRFTEASLVKTMEDKGIGRPATYTPTVTLLFSRKYMELEGKFIKPTDLGFRVTDMLIKYFPDVMDVEFTAEMERKLDDIEDGGKVWQNVISDFYGDFEREIAMAQGDSFNLRSPDEVSNFRCEKCGRLMVFKQGKFGKFLACPNYPTCKNTKTLDKDGNIIEKHVEPPRKSDELCPKCGKPMVIRSGKYGDFLACTGYPECKTIINLKGQSGEKKD